MRKAPGIFDSHPMRRHIFRCIIGAAAIVFATANVCQAAYFLYRERFLAAKYGPEVIEDTLKPAEDIDPHYPEEMEEM